MPVLLKVGIVAFFAMLCLSSWLLIFGGPQGLGWAGTTFFNDVAAWLLRNIGNIALIIVGVFFGLTGGLNRVWMVVPGGEGHRDQLVKMWVRVNSVRVEGQFYTWVKRGQVHRINRRHLIRRSLFGGWLATMPVEPISDGVSVTHETRNADAIKAQTLEGRVRAQAEELRRRDLQGRGR